MAVEVRPVVLVVDDDPILLSSVADILRVGGYDMLTAINGLEALTVMHHQQPDLILADVMMPEMDGFAFYQAVRDNPAWMSIPFIFLSALGEPSDVRRGYTLGADHYLVKPFEPEDLLIAVESRLRRTAEVRSAVQQEVERIKHQLVDVFSHELRTPLTFIYGYLSLLQESPRALGDETVEEILAGMRRGTDRLVALVEDLLLITYLDSGVLSLEMDHHRRHVNLSLEIQEAMRRHSVEAEEKNIAISMVVPHDLTVLGICNYIQDIFHRLIDNAIKFSPPGGRVWVRASQQDGVVAVEVRDQGVGIPLEQQHRLFDRLTQIDREWQEQRGVGLGLAIADRLARLHGGTIEVESTPGQGSTFTVTLPLASVEGDEPVAGRG
ncbi:MAG: hybrid sensor histidine kinase/response regulator [Anaerolineae bacterium]